MYVRHLVSATCGVLLLAGCASASTPIPTSAPAGQPTSPPTGAQNPTTAPAAATPAVAVPASTPGSSASANGGTLTLNGAGSSFDNPLFSKAFAEYTKTHPKVQVNYQSVGSGAGIQQLTQGTVDFGASDAPLTDEQLAAAENDVVHVPVTLGAVSVAYNLPGVNEGLKLSGDALAKIFLGTIKKWNDPAIAQLNPDVQLPNTDIAVVHRSDGSGTTDIFTTYLAAASQEWKDQVGSGLSVDWPVGLGGKGSEGVAGQVKQIPGGIGYFEMAYAKQNGLTSAAIQSGDQYLVPNIDGATACAAGIADKLPADLRVRIAGCSGQNAYPISGFSWVVLHQNQKDAARGQAMVNLLWWLTHDGQQYSTDLFYAPLPPQVVSKDEQQLSSIKANGQPIQPAH
ncbi:MAG: phosphate ABC transporter substrate-binding protein PstS [Chloroflexi bacterium]|nr:phosphate ABC transporter substrate-binding protein PstS [Chloroflexota bacterium]